MREWVGPIVVLGVYVVLMRWVLPGLGIPTCLSGACRRQPKLEQKTGTHS